MVHAHESKGRDDMKRTIRIVALCAAVVVQAVGLIALAQAPAAEGLEIRLLFDNTAAEPGFKEGWGFAAAVAAGSERLLFDAGAAPETLLHNAERMKVDLGSFERVLISHRHGDHTDGLPAVQARNPKVTILWPDPRGAFDIAPRFHSTGALGSPAGIEQALVVDTPGGLVILTGCSHPGVVRLVEAALAQRKASRVRCLIGGFHMLQQSRGQVSEAIAALRRLNVERVAPTHCTGPAAIEMFRAAWGKDFEPAGAGRVIVLD